MLAIYIHLPQTLFCQPAITSVAAGVAVCCRICSTTVNRLISPADIVSYLMQNSRLLDDNSGPVVGSQFCSVAKICRSNRIRKSGLPLTANLRLIWLVISWPTVGRTAHLDPVSHLTAVNHLAAVKRMQIACLTHVEQQTEMVVAHGRTADKCLLQVDIDS